MAEKKYPANPNGFEKLQQAILDGLGPKTSKTTKTTKKGAVDRLTDTSKYTGLHKERFDESGKGKGLAGRYNADPEAQKAAEGYVGGYKGMDTYGKTH